jgi:hypothetical protein
MSAEAYRPDIAAQYTQPVEERPTLTVHEGGIKDLPDTAEPAVEVARPNALVNGPIGWRPQESGYGIDTLTGVGIFSTEAFRRLPLAEVEAARRKILGSAPKEMTVGRSVGQDASGATVFDFRREARYPSARQAEIDIRNEVNRRMR